jgi:TFIIH p62 subunit, N-terminal domain
VLTAQVRRNYSTPWLYIQSVPSILWPIRSRCTAIVVGIVNSASAPLAWMDCEIERRASFEKKTGIVQLSPTHLVWTPDSAADGGELRIAFLAIRSYQVTNATAKKVSHLDSNCFRNLSDVSEASLVRSTFISFLVVCLLN